MPTGYEFSVKSLIHNRRSVASLAILLVRTRPSSMHVKEDGLTKYKDGFMERKEGLIERK